MKPRNRSDKKALTGEFIYTNWIDRVRAVILGESRHYIRSGADTPITERALEIVTRRQAIKNNRADDKAWSSLTTRCRE